MHHIHLATVTLIMDIQRAWNTYAYICNMYI